MSEKQKMARKRNLHRGNLSAIKARLFQLIKSDTMYPREKEKLLKLSAEIGQMLLDWESLHPARARDTHLDT